MLAAIGGFIEAAARAVVRAADGPGRAARSPHHRVNRLAVIGREDHLDGAGVLILICSLLPGSAAIERAKEAALGVRAVRVPEDGDENAIGIARVNGDGTDLLAVAQAEMLPGLAGVGGFVDAIAGREVGAAQSFAAADIN